MNMIYNNSAFPIQRFAKPFLFSALNGRLLQKNGFGLLDWKSGNRPFLVRGRK